MNIFFYITILLAFVVLVLGILKWKKLHKSAPHSVSLFNIWFITLFCLFFNIAGLIYGLSLEFENLKTQGDLSPSLVAGGIKHTLVISLTCLLTFLTGLIVWGVLYKIKERKIREEMTIEK